MVAGLMGRLCWKEDEFGNACIITDVQYWTTTFCLYTIGYPVANAVCFAIFAKVHRVRLFVSFFSFQPFVLGNKFVCLSLHFLHSPFRVRSWARRLRAR